MNESQTGKQEYRKAEQKSRQHRQAYAYRGGDAACEEDGVQSEPILVLLDALLERLQLRLLLVQHVQQRQLLTVVRLLLLLLPPLALLCR